MRIPDSYLEKIYGGFLGMNMGIQLGAPVESALWSYERLEKTFPDLREPIYTYKKFAADDDVNGPVFFIRALYDDARDRELCPQDVARAWLNYTREGRGMFWWGGYGVSTEHTAYLNLKNGIEAPASGSAQVNGRMISEQIGGQIFIDTWGLVWPCNPTKAADYGEAAARVSHDGEGVWGARFFCAAIAEAFQCEDIEHIIQRALEEIPEDSQYAQVVREVIQFYHEQDEKDFRSCRSMLTEKWGYERFGGCCPILSNAGVCALAMLYGQGDLGRTIEIAVMCGWDTDCNAGNVGTVLGVMNGTKDLPERYRKPMNDSIVLSSAAGSLNILDIPTFCKELEQLGRTLAGERKEQKAPSGELCFDFNLPGSTHGFLAKGCTISNQEGAGQAGTGALKVLVDSVSTVKHGRIWYKPFYTREDFEDERYDPAFSPQVYPGQILEASLRLEVLAGDHQVGVIPYVKTVLSGTVIEGSYEALSEEGFSTIRFEIPETGGENICEIGLQIVGSGCFTNALAAVYVDSFRVFGSFHHKINLKTQKEELGTITPFVINRGHWERTGDELEAFSLEKTQAYTGNYGTRDVTLEAVVKPVRGENHLLAVRTQGLERAYYAGFTSKGKAAIVKELFGERILSETDFGWEEQKEYHLKVEAKGSKITLSVDGQKLLEAEDGEFSYGMYGCVRTSAGRTVYRTIETWGDM